MTFKELSESIQEILGGGLKDINPLKVMLSTIANKYLYLDTL